MDTGNNMDSADDAADQQSDNPNPLDSTFDWFSKDDSKEINSEILQAADEIVSGQHEFKQKLRGFLKKHVGGKLPTTKEMLDEQITNYGLDYHSTRNAAMDALSDANGAQQSYQRERQTGVKKAGKLTQDFVKTFADFLGVYSGIISLMKGAGSMYGEVAYETLSILFIVVVNKSQNDTKIAGLLNELRKSFPRLDDWTSIYPTLAMKTLVTEVYKQIIDFARHTSVYFTRFTTRLWSAIGRPPSKGIDQTAAQVHKKLAEVSSEAMIHLHKRSQSIHVTVQDSNNQIRDLQRQNKVLVHAYERLAVDYGRFREEVEREQENQDIQQLQHFKETLNLSYPSSSTVLEACASTHQRAFHSSSPRKNPYHSMTPEYLRSLPSFNTWLATKTSSLLFLGGKTRPESRAHQGYTHSWLSSTAFHVVESIRNDGGNVAFYCCHPGVRAEGDHDGRDVVSMLTFQILEWRPKVLRKNMAQFQALVRSKAWTRLRSDEEKEEEDMHLVERNALRAWFLLLKGVLTAVREDDREKENNGKSGRGKSIEATEAIRDAPDIKNGGDSMVYLVLDRVDLVACSLRHFMAELVELVKDEKCLVKVLVVTDTPRWSWDTEGLEDEERVNFVQDLDQQRGHVDLARLVHSKSYPF